MSSIRPLVLVGGTVSVLPIGDTVGGLPEQDSYYQEVSYSGDLVSYITFYKQTPFVDANRISRIDYTYSGDVVTSEVREDFDTDGTTVLKTYTWTYTYSSGNFVSSFLAVS